MAAKEARLEEQAGWSIGVNFVCAVEMLPMWCHMAWLPHPGPQQHAGSVLFKFLTSKSTV